MIARDDKGRGDAFMKSGCRESERERERERERNLSLLRFAALRGVGNHY
jgi:hypothetical protein